ncbi:uncharacterized protein LOC142557853 isoform X2 [Dermacentor variabilis]|uniref:uncharacterized protein LOC142557853 isoform X2 n=1 Tax=Dermacentor variabilis TaxID=34621 RepID=UPI003F5BF87F
MSHPSLVFGARMASSKVPYQLIFLVTHPADRRTDQPVLQCTAKLGLLPRGLNCAAGDDICRWKRCADDEVESQACVVPMLILSRCGSGRLAARGQRTQSEEVMRQMRSSRLGRELPVASSCVRC